MTGNNRTIAGGGFHHVSIKVADFDRCVAFYTRSLGFRPVLAWGEGDRRAVMLDSGDRSCLEVFAGGSAAPKSEDQAAIVHFCLATTDVDVALAAARAGGAEVTLEPTDVDMPVTPPTRVRIAFFRGPGGEMVELLQNR
jgi:glyoxylase I family protein